MVAWWNLSQDTIVVVAFDGINGRVFFFEFPNGNKVRPTRQWTGNMVEVDNDRGLLGNFQERETKVKSKTIWFKENILKIEKVFQEGKNPLKLGTNFLGVTTLPPLKRISSQDLETNRDSRGYTRYFLYGLIYPYI